ncbi:WRKY DNA-binding transcription factor 70-like [Andrographis paniculata]|uniref:WRKY DNA-binding transcription factor 70-like n=1 Tax=Andrographis paniculata TaxID=175694 RepID=UPI0021E906D1|nr:WRKY DNA-binding transcription factor 70-like [Andrographis paniculata]
MDDPYNQGNHAVRKTVIAELLKGREVTMQLQTLIRKPVRDRGAVDVEALALQIFRSFSNSLSVISSCADSTSSAPISDGRKRKPPVKTRRGCYRRRRTSDSWMIISPVEDDGYAWRKYGQKDILNFEFPRCYYRCTHKQEGCRAIKQVQKIKDDPALFQTTYLSHHTCSHTPRPPLVDNNHHDQIPNLLSFDQSNNPAPITRPTNPTLEQPAPLLSIKQEDPNHQDASSSDDAKSSSPLQDAWREIFGYEWEEAAGASCGSTSFDGISCLEFNGQFPDIESFQFE